MDINQQFYIDVIKALHESRVDYLLVGGMAVGFHGYSRYTGDMDLWLRPSQENLERTKKALQSLGYDVANIDNIFKERPIDHVTPIRLFDDANEFKVDLMTTIFYDKLSFDKCFEKAQHYQNGDLSMNVIHVNHLIEIKENIKRIGHNSMKDLIDAEKLKSIHHEKAHEVNKTKGKEKDQGFSM